ncbi:MAG: cytidylate kinase-like family protein [Oscillospiraceae bacterium]|nr:cytidylate kinase-like family protein [Oscillospiraceae bacterium]
MNRIITIGREFGSGGRELGRRLAEELQIAYYDEEIIREIAKSTELSEHYVQQVLEKRPYPLFPITIGRSFYPTEGFLHDQTQSVYKEQSRIIREMAELIDCVIVCRCADYILAEYKPFRIFVYADMASKMARCRAKGPEHEHFSDKELRQHIQSVDKHRASYYEFYTGLAWGDKLSYDLCVNTTNTEIKTIVPFLAKIFL